MIKFAALLAYLFSSLQFVAADAGFYQFLESLGSREAILGQLGYETTQYQNGTINPFHIGSPFSVDESTRVPVSDLSCDDPLALQCDLEALFSFKSLMSQSAQEALSSWQGSNPCDGQWKGIQCEDVFPGGPRVVQIQLGNFYYTKLPEEDKWLEMFNGQHVPQLNCAIDEAIGDKIKFLQVLNLKGCNVHGLPESLKQATKLQVLSLANNKLNGQDADSDITIPSWLAELTDLRILDLANTGISGSLPSELSSLTKIEIVNLYYNHLTGEVPPEYSSWVDPSTYPHLHLFLVSSGLADSDLCISQETKSAFENSVIIGGSDVFYLPICEEGGDFDNAQEQNESVKK